MSEIIKKFSDESVLEYDNGKFDKWCVYLTRPNATKYPPTDVQYFERLYQYGMKYGVSQIYSDFIEIFNLTKRAVEENVLIRISEISAKYGEDSLSIEIDYTILYAGMIAEENKEFSVLGKRIKRLGVFQVLIEGMPPKDAAYFSRGKKAYEISAICKERGF